MNSVIFNLNHPIGNVLAGVAALGNVNPRGFVDWLVLSRFDAPYFTENVSVPRLVDAPQRWLNAFIYVDSYMQTERERTILEEVAVCYRAIVQDEFYNKNRCMPHLIFNEKDEGTIARILKTWDRFLVGSLTAIELVTNLWMGRDVQAERKAYYGFFGPNVVAKLENSGRCTLDGHEEQVVVMCNQQGTNLTMSNPVAAVYSRLDKCQEKFDERPIRIVEWARVAFASYFAKKDPPAILAE